MIKSAGAKRTRAIASDLGVSWLSVVISLLMFAFLLYIYANGSMKIYYGLLFPAATSTGPQQNSVLGGSSNQNSQSDVDAYESSGALSTGP